MLENLQCFVEELVQKKEEFSLYICEEMVTVKMVQLVGKGVEVHQSEPKVLQLIAQVLSSLCEIEIKEEVKEKKKMRHFAEIEDETEEKEVETIK